MSKLKVFLIKIGLIVPPAGFKYNPVDVDGDGKVQEGTKFERYVGLDEVKKKRPVKKAVKKTAKKKAPVKKKAKKKAK